ncbi:MAG: large conductance mechanosensitive channel protein MscL [Candidatus Aureabacteria bacterium]|nr:large conductance mechanosensitive channel protein MscL [Candidatus Auribacterota bacterium]HOE27989.1 large conductance mechanosensitive channel protein MscL [bacterium]HQM51857.1 large conductance mechanosensitive channel protein MscL [bacterium]
MAVKVKVFEEFKAFLVKSNALALAIGVIIGAATGKLVGSLVNDVLMPVIGRVTGGIDFSNLYINLTPSVAFENYAKAKEAGAALGYGVFINNIIDFVIISFVVFMITKALLKEKPAPAGPATKTCRECGETVLASARKCKWCGSALS